MNIFEAFNGGHYQLRTDNRKTKTPLRELLHDHIGNFLDEGLVDFGIGSGHFAGAGGRLRGCLDGVFAGVAKFALFEFVETVIGHTELFSQDDKFFELVGAVLLGATELHSHGNGLAEGIRVFHLPVGVFDVFAPADDSMILHENGLVFFGQSADFARVFRSAGGLVAGKADFTEEYLGLGDEAGRWSDAGYGEGGSVYRVRVDAGLGLGLVLHDAKMSIDLGSTGTRTGYLIAVEIDHADVVGSHEALGDERRGAEHEVVANANGNIAAVAVDVALVPNALTDVADALLELLDFGGVEEALQLGGGLGVATGLPVELLVGEYGFVNLYRYATGGCGRRGGWLCCAVLAQDITRHWRELGIGDNSVEGLSLGNQSLEVFGCVEFTHNL